MKIGSRFKGMQKKQEKIEKRRAKTEGREVHNDFPPLVLIALVAVGSMLALAGPISILVIIFPLLTRNMVKWDFRICVKLSAMISIVFLITNLILGYNEFALKDIIIWSFWQLATLSLIMYMGSFIVNMMQGKRAM
ncbi:MAG: hypothetical protein ACXQT0_00400 [Candidatus Methanofastidiosia archaeon]